MGYMRLLDLLPEVIEAIACHLNRPRDGCAFAATCKRVRYVVRSLTAVRRRALCLFGMPCRTCRRPHVHGVVESVPHGCYSCDFSLFYRIAEIARDLAAQEHKITARPAYLLDVLSSGALAAITDQSRALVKRTAALGYGQLSIRAARLYLRSFAWEATAHWLSTDAWYSYRFDMTSLGAAAFFALDPLPPRFGVRMPEGWRAIHATDPRPTKPYLTCCASMVAPLLKLFCLAPAAPDSVTPRLPQPVKDYLRASDVMLDVQGGTISVFSNYSLDSLKMPTPMDALLLLLPSNDIANHEAHDDDLPSRIHADCLRDAILARLPCPRDMRSAQYSGCAILRAGNMRTVMSLMYGDGCVDSTIPTLRRPWIGAPVTFAYVVARGGDDDARALFDTKGGRAVLRDYARSMQAYPHRPVMWSVVFPHWLQIAHRAMGLDGNTFDRSATLLWYVACELAASAYVLVNAAAADLSGFAASRDQLLCDRPFALLAASIVSILGICYREDLAASVVIVVCQLKRADILSIGDAMGLPRPRLLADM